MSTIIETILNRKAVYPAQYNVQKEIPPLDLETILKCANRAPTHRRTEPWRWVVFQGAGKTALAEYLVAHYGLHTPPEKYSEEKAQKQRFNPEKSAAVIAILMHRDPEHRVPEWEELAAVSCAVENMWLACTELGIGCYWSTPPAKDGLCNHLGLDSGLHCYGFFYMGYTSMELPLTERGDWKEKVLRWV